MTENDLTGPIRNGEDASAIPDTAKNWSEIARLLTLSQRTLGRLLTGVAPVSESELMLLWVCSKSAGEPSAGEDDVPSAEGQAQVGLAEALGMSPGQVSSLVERLRSRDLLESNRSTSDRRRRLWRLTSGGRDCLADAGRVLAERAGDLNRHLNPSEQDLLRDLLQRVASTNHNASTGRKERAA